MVPSGAATPSPAVLIAVDDASLAELLADALDDAGRIGLVAEDRAAVEAAVATTRFSAAIIDLDTRGRDAPELVAWLRDRVPDLKIIVLLPCGGLPPPVEHVPYHLAIAKPARLQALLSAVMAAGTPGLVHLAK